MVKLGIKTHKLILFSQPGHLQAILKLLGLKEVGVGHVGGEETLKRSQGDTFISLSYFLVKQRILLKITGNSKLGGGEPTSVKISICQAVLGAAIFLVSANYGLLKHIIS